ADWFAVTAPFRQPLGLPIPHTAIIPARRAKIIEGIVTMVEEDWLSPDAISARLARLAPGALVVEWLRDPAHVERVSAPVRDVLRGLAPTLTGAEAVGFVERALQRQLRELPVDVGTGAWLRRGRAAGGSGRPAAPAPRSGAGRPAPPCGAARRGGPQGARRRRAAADGAPREPRGGSAGARRARAAPCPARAGPRRPARRAR